MAKLVSRIMNQQYTKFMSEGASIYRLSGSLKVKVLFMSKISNITEIEFQVLEIASSSAPGASKLMLAVVYRHEEGHVLNFLM